jgi:hypothetical protein
MAKAMGQPAEHLPHWLQERTLSPLISATFLTKSLWIVCLDISILIL